MSLSTDEQPPIIVVEEAAPPAHVLRKKRTIFRAYQVIWYVLGVIEVLLAFRILLKMVSANPQSGFTRFIYLMTYPLAAPFFGVVSASGSDGPILEWSSIIAMLVYLVVAYGIARLFQFVKPVKSSEVNKEIDAA